MKENKGVSVILVKKGAEYDITQVLSSASIFEVRQLVDAVWKMTRG
jgi:hypothetical protein